MSPACLVYEIPFAGELLDSKIYIMNLIFFGWEKEKSGIRCHSALECRSNHGARLAREMDAMMKNCPDLSSVRR